MFSKRRLATLFDHRLARRVLITPVVVLVTLFAIALSPLIVGASALADLITERTTWRRTRLSILVITALVIETTFLAASLLVWIATGFNRAGADHWRWRIYRPFLGWYTALLIGLIARVLGTRISWREHGDVSKGPVIVIARHTSFFDALIPATMLSRHNQLLAHHVLTHGLRYLPNLDIVGHRFPNRFVKRSPGEGSNELVHLEELGSTLTAGSSVVIFPEGTFRTPDRAERVVRRIRRRHPDLAARAERLEHVLPPIANGTFALLAGAPDADVVVCTNTGLESFGSLRAIRSRPVADQPIIVETWRIQRSDIPAELDEFNVWLFDQFVEIDNWVSEQKDLLANRSQG